MSKVYTSADQLIGHTPLLELTHLEKKYNLEAKVIAKVEYFNPAGSVKDRIAKEMIQDALEKGLINENTTLIEPTSGNTGIALAMIGRLKGYKVIIVMPETMSKERRDLIKAYGAELVLTEGNRGMKGAIEKATQMVNEHGYFMPQQFENIANPEKHYATTAQEIYEDINDLNVLVAGVGTGGTITGIGKNLKEKINDIEIVAIEPSNSQVISGKNPGPHKIQGIGAGFVPQNYKNEYVDKVVAVSDEDAIKTAVDFAKSEGILVGISSGAAIYTAIKIAKKLGKGKKVLAIAPDGGEKQDQY